jgi:hypothetical protein
MIPVYRVEDEEGIGPYNSCLLSAYLIIGDDHKISKMFEDHLPPLHPSITSDLKNIHGFGPDHVCCFKTLDQLKEWFGDYLLPLLLEGFNVVEYLVHPYHILETHTGRQIAAFIEIEQGENKRIISQL